MRAGTIRNTVGQPTRSRPGVAGLHPCSQGVPLRIHIVTLFPEMFDGPFRASIIGRAAANGLVEFAIHQLRGYAHDRHRTVDDEPYGGGPGMVMKPEPLFEAVESILQAEAAEGQPRPRVVLMSTQGRPLTQAVTQELSEEAGLILVCGHYEGVDERVAEHLADDEISVGDYVLTGGELPAMVLVDAVVRLLPGVLGCSGSAAGDSFSPGRDGLLDGPVYTRPYDFRGWRVPDVLLSGDHARVDEWRREQALERTRRRRPDLLDDGGGGAQKDAGCR